MRQLLVFCLFLLRNIYKIYFTFVWININLYKREIVRFYKSRRRCLPLKGYKIPMFTNLWLHYDFKWLIAKYFERSWEFSTWQKNRPAQLSKVHRINGKISTIRPYTVRCLDEFTFFSLPIRKFLCNFGLQTFKYRFTIPI